MWKEPRISDLDAPTHMTNKIRTAVFYNSAGKLVGADNGVIIQYLVAVLVTTWMLCITLILVIPNQLIMVSLTTLVLTAVSLGLWYRWGWRNYEQAWYHIDTENKIFTVIRKERGEWVEIEVPFENVNKVEWSGGSNGYAMIHAAGMVFGTTRANTERYASVTEMWPVLAGFDTYMEGWPITLKCMTCNREFGHHLGTARCPFDGMMLLDQQSKGRIDPEEMHPDDYNRV